MVLQIPFRSHEKGSIHVFFYGFPNYLTFKGSFKDYAFHNNLVIEAMMKAKTPSKTLVQMGHAIENLNFLGVFNGNMLTIAKSFLGSNSLFSLDTIYPNMIIEYT
jgi:hypothetical protein